MATSRAQAIFDSVGVALGTVLTDLINVFNSPLYLLGGGLAGAWDRFETSMYNELKQRSFAYREYPPRVERAVLGGDAGLFGNAFLALDASK